MNPASATNEVVRRVRREVPADLEHAALFGSRARGDAGPDSDFDILLVFRELPPDREPFATHAEVLTERLAKESGVPVSVWSVSLLDFEVGRRTPMLVDALEDAIPLWYRTAPPPRLPYTPADALFCTAALLDRIAESGSEFNRYIGAGSLADAAQHARADVLRLCTAALLLRGITRPRRAEAIHAFLATEGGRAAVPPAIGRLCDWAASSSVTMTDAEVTARAIEAFVAEIDSRRARLAMFPYSA
ncbi:MAG TPA: nucleotidyltransferase domain-containing protein [Longimicrobiaceae bacterium]|nr:nucleotidyltransferase domain-containing protein [Longimicrobiaceae bacterium]